jgi:hypothetical protein
MHGSPGESPIDLAYDFRAPGYVKSGNIMSNIHQPGESLQPFLEMRKNYALHLGDITVLRAEIRK